MTRVAALAALFVIAVPSLASAASFVLSGTQVEQAIEVGERSVTQDGLGPEWEVRQGTGPLVTVMTPFHRFALAARHAAFRNEPLTPRDRRRLVKDQKDRLVFWVELKGPREDFARFFIPRLIVGARQLEASFTQNERTAARTDDNTYVARCAYGFPTKLINEKGKVVLLIRDGDGRDLASIPVDLSTMR